MQKTMAETGLAAGMNRPKKEGDGSKWNHPFKQLFLFLALNMN